MDDQTWRPEDYHVQFEDSYYEGEVAKAPLVHKIRPVMQYVHEILMECRRCLTVSVDAQVPAAMTSLAVVDYLVGFHAGRKSKREDYEAFLFQFFPEYRPFIDRIYLDLRCGLMHNLVAINPWGGQQDTTIRLIADSPNHLTVEDGQLVWSIRTFVEHIGRALVIYQHHLLMGNNAESIRRFNERFNRLGGAAALMQKVPD